MKMQNGRRAAPERSAKRGNPLLAAWATPYGMPPFDRIEPAHFRSAFDAAIKAHRREIRAIAAQEAAPDFANTIAALERSGSHLQRVSSAFFALASAHTSDALQAIERQIAPVLAGHEHWMHTNRRLYARIRAIAESGEAARLSEEEKRVLERYRKLFLRAGADLKGRAKDRMQTIVTRLAELNTRFAQNVLASEAGSTIELDEKDASGLPPFLLDAARDAARTFGSKAGYVITMSRSSIEPFLRFCENRALREKAFDLWLSRGAGGGYDNRAVAAEILKLRRERARLLGYRDHAAYSFEESMAKSADAARALLMRVWPVARAQALKERDELQDLIRAEGGNFRLAAADWRFYAEKLRRQRFSIDEADVKPYLRLDSMIEAAFETARRLFGLTFEERRDVPVYHPDVRVWEVFSGAGAPVGLFIGDYFARPSKRGGAWMSALRPQHRLDGDVRPVVLNVMNFAKSGDGAPALLSLDDARTLFHEFGHGLHGLLSNVTYPIVSGTNVAQDFVELPSQLFEHWLLTPDILQRFARHAQTGEAMPPELLERVLAARHFNTGFQTVEYLASAIVDLDLHEADVGEDFDIEAEERRTLERIGMPAEIAPRHRAPHFLHLFAGDGYAAGYYSYFWSELMDADAFTAFEETGEVFHAETARRLHDFIYASGGSIDPEAAYVSFRGRMPDVGPLLMKRGLMAADRRPKRRKAAAA